MQHYDIFNGDADGILSLVQLRLAQPKDATLVTGVKRDISLVKQVNVSHLDSSSEITILDIFLQKYS